MSIKNVLNQEYPSRHIGPRADEIDEMLSVVGVESMEQLIDETVPSNIRLPELPDTGRGMTEFEFLNHVRSLAEKNQVWRSYIGLGYYGTVTPSVILRNVLENPGWYTQYTPYQAEISQGRLEGLLNFQTMVLDLTGMEIANASLLDESTAAAEAMAMLYRLRSSAQNKAGAVDFWVAEEVFPQTLAVLKNRALPLGINLKIAPAMEIKFDETSFGALLQYPSARGDVKDYRSLIRDAHARNNKVVMAADLLSLTLLTPPGEMDADVTVGSTQRFGVPMGYGGPHAAYFATREAYKRQTPGRIIGVSVDRNGKPAYRMALQTREQHIRRDKATSNICTAQALLAIMAGFYGVYHGPQGLRNIAERIHQRTALLDSALQQAGYEQLNTAYFGTLQIHAKKEIIVGAVEKLKGARINVWQWAPDRLSVSFDETVSDSDVREVANLFAAAAGKTVTVGEAPDAHLPAELQRRSPFMQHPVFNRYRSETEMMRYIKRLENKDLSLTTSMIPLGSCTMKLNPATSMLPITWPGFANIHPFVPADQAAGYRELIADMEKDLCAITGFKAVSFQPNSGAQGEYTGMSVIQAYHRSRGEGRRNVVLIPSSAHGTNPASATMVGGKVVVVKCDGQGNIDLVDLQARAGQYADTLSAFMVTYPSTHGVFEEKIREMVDLIHAHGGQVYMDGANMNAQVGLTSPGYIGADVCHLNLHKTFSIPHGGGGPGVGPIAVAEHLKPFLPGHPLVDGIGGTQAIAASVGAPFGSAGVLPISYAYIKMLGAEGLRAASEMAILNANYLKARLGEKYTTLYSGQNGRVGHEMIVDVRSFKQGADIDVIDLAKRLMDYGFHAPTVAWPVHGTMMIEPTESESKQELDRFCEALIAIYQEMQEVVEGKADRENNLLKNAPHVVNEIAADDWDKPYSRSRAAFPLAYLREHKFWPATSRINDTYGDRHLFCSCPPPEAFEKENPE